MTDPESRTGNPEIAKEARSSWPTRIGSRVYKLLVDLGPIATLVAIILTNWHSCRNYAIGKDSSRAILYVRDILFLPDEDSRDVVSQVGVVVMNAGPRPAHVVKHKSYFFIIPVGGPRPDVGETAVEDTDETVDREHPLTFSMPIPDRLSGPGITTTKELLQVLNRQGLQLYIAGRMKYFDGMDEYSLNWCKYLSGSAKWDTCPVAAAR